MFLLLVLLAYSNNNKYYLELFRAMDGNLSEIKQRRKKIGLSQIQLAKLADVSQSLIAKIEAGKIDPTYTKTKRIFDALDKADAKEDKKIKEVMNPKIISVKPSDSVRETIQKMRRYDISQLPVIDNEVAVGCVSEATLLDALLENKQHSTVDELMADPPPVVPTESSLHIVTGLLRHFPMVLISSKGKLAGVITKQDMLKMMLG